MGKAGKLVLLVGLSIVFIGVMASALSKSSNTLVAPNSNTNSAGTSAPVAPDPATTITISNTTVKTDQYYTTVVGEALNNDTIKHSMFLKATFYAADGSILGTASGALNDVAPGEKKTFTLITTDKITGYANYKVQVDTLV